MHKVSFPFLRLLGSQKTAVFLVEESEQPQLLESEGGKKPQKKERQRKRVPYSVHKLYTHLWLTPEPYICRTDYS